MRRPSDDIVSWAIIEVLRSHGVIHSQRKLAQMVAARLRDLDPAYAVGEGRLRRVALRIPQVEVQVELRQGGEAKLDRCPCCGARLHARWGKDLFGKRRLQGRVCTACGLHMGAEGGIPSRYVFIWRSGRAQGKKRRGSRGPLDAFPAT